MQWLKNGTPQFETDEGEWHDGRQVKVGTQSWSSGRYEGELVGRRAKWSTAMLTVQKFAIRGRVSKWQSPTALGTLTAGSETVQRLLEGRVLARCNARPQSAFPCRPVADVDARGWW